MKFITVKSKQTTVSVDLVPPLVLGDKQRVSLVDIRIPEQNNARRLQQVIEYKSQGEVINFEISITDKGAYLAAQENEVLFSEELAKNITQVSGKSTKDVTTYCREPAHYQELFRFVSAGLELEQHFLGLACLSPHHLEALVLFVEL